MKSSLSLYINSNHSCLFGNIFKYTIYLIFVSLRLQIFLFVYCARVEEQQESVTGYLQSRIDNHSVTDNGAKLFHIAVV